MLEIHRMKPDLIKKFNLKIIGSPKGDVLLFANGYGCDLSMWRYVTPVFENSYKIALFDHMGSGNSDISHYSSSRYSNLNAYAEDLMEIARFLDSDRINLVAHSVSCMIGGLAAIKEPHLFSRIIMIGPSPCYINYPSDNYIGGFSSRDIDDLMDSLDNNYLGWVSAVTPVIMGNPERPELTDELSNIFCRNDPKIAKQFASVTFKSDNRNDLDRIPVPCHVIQSETDSIAPSEVGEYISNKIPDCDLHIIPTHGHCPHLSHPEEIINTMKDILEKYN